MAIKTEERAEIRKYLATAKGIAWDTCHKIYILMDDEQMELMREYEYDPLISSEEMTLGKMSATITRWYDESCNLRFVQAVSTDPKDPDEGFVSLVSQRW
jgi:hypothetical protein